MQRRSYPRNHFERHGQVNVRNSNTSRLSGQQTEDDGKSSCIIVVTKRKGFGSTGNSESYPMSEQGADFLFKSFPKDKFYRYKVNIYLKK